MAAYMIGNSRITNPESCEAYVPAVVATLLANGAEILVADYDSDVVEGQASSVTVAPKFASREAACTWYDSPEYQEIVHLRTDNSEGFIVLADEFVMP